MRKRRWPVRLGAALIVISSAIGVLAALRPEAGAEAGPKEEVQTAGPCSDSPIIPGRRVTALLGTWWKTTERLDATGTLIGRQLFVGRDGAARALVELAAESSVSGPVGGVVVATTDDGNESEIRLLSVSRACAWVAHRTDAVVRSAILDPSDGTIYLHSVDRSSRADRGTWAVAVEGDPRAEPLLVAPPLDPEGAARQSVGVVWSTRLHLDAPDTKLAVQSCGDLGCLVRIFDLHVSSTAPRTVGGPDQGDLLGFAGDEVVTWARCPGLPCSIVGWDPSGGRRRALVEDATSAGLTRDGRRLAVVLASGPVSRRLEVDPATGAGRPLAGLPPGLAPLPVGVDRSAGLEIADDEIVIGSPTSDPRAFRPDGPSEVIP